MTQQDERDVMAVERLRTLVDHQVLEVLEGGFDPYAMGRDGNPDQIVEPIVALFPAARFETTERDGVRLRRVVLAGEWEVDPMPAPPAIPHPFVSVRYKGRIQEGCGHFTRVTSRGGRMCGAPKSAHLAPNLDGSDCLSPVNRRCACPAPPPVDESVPAAERY